MALIDPCSAVQRKTEVERKGNELIFHLARLRGFVLTRYFTAKVFRYINTKYETAHQRRDLTRGELCLMNVGFDIAASRLNKLHTLKRIYPMKGCMKLVLLA